MIRVVDAFCGAGGLSLGFAQAGFKIAAGIDHDFDSTETFARAHATRSHIAMSGCEVFLADVDDVHLTAGVADVVIGGPPCQPWSNGGKRRGHEDERDGWPAFLRLIGHNRPVAFVAENVPGFLASWQMLPVVEHMRTMGYVVGWHVLDAARYGTPQHRRRLFIVGLRAGTGYRFEWPQPSADVIPVRTLGFGRRPLGEPNPAAVTFARKPHVRWGPYSGLLVNGGGRPLDLDRPAPTVVASAAGNRAPWLDLGNVMPKYHVHLVAGGQPRSGVVPGARRLTDAELALVQGFPGDYRFYGSRSSRMRQVGNAVPPPLAKAIATQLMKAFHHA